MNKIDVYLNMMYEIQMISEDIGINIPNINKGFIQKINNSIDEKDPYGTIKKIKRLAPPGININVVQKAENYLSKNYKKFSSFKSIASTVIKNSLPDVNPRIIDVASSFLSFSSMITKKGDENKKPDVILKMNIKTFITKCRKFGEDYDDEDKESKLKLRPGDVTDLSVAWVVITMATALAIGLITGTKIVTVAVATFLTASLPGILYTTLCFLFVLGIILVLGQVAQGV